LRTLWFKEAWRIAALGLLLTAVGFAVGHVTLLLLVGLVSYIAWHYFNLVRLERWLKQGKKFEPPSGYGIWDELFNDIYRLQVRNRKRKRKLARFLQRFREATAVWPDAAVILDKREAIEWANARASELLGLELPHDVGQPITYLVRHPAFIAFLERGSPAQSLEIPSPTDPDVHLLLHVLPFGKKQQRLLTARDITRLHRLEQVRRDFIANVSHELRTPLTVLAGYLETLTDAADELPEGWAHSLQLMQEQTARMQRIVNDLLLLARLEAEDQQPVQEAIRVPKMLEAIACEAQALSGTRAHHITLEAQEVDLHGNAGDLRSAFTNLVMNAVQYTPPRGTIRIRWYSDERGAHMEVSDTGVGIEPQHIPRLTERFYRVDVARSRQSGGTGLGLAIVNHVLQRHDAQLHIESVPGKGSSFRCDFPPSRVFTSEAAVIPSPEV
jgi:two-component system phosphate regulon sensor histidine kinase PhoR